MADQMTTDHFANMRNALRAKDQEGYEVALVGFWEAVRAIVREEMTASTPPPQKTPQKRFCKPTPVEVTEYAASLGFLLAGDEFCDFYESKGWKVGNTPMKSWQAAVRTWKLQRTGPKTAVATGLCSCGCGRKARIMNEGKGWHVKECYLHRRSP